MELSTAAPASYFDRLANYSSKASLQRNGLLKVDSFRSDLYVGGPTQKARREAVRKNTIIHLEAE